MRIRTLSKQVLVETDWVPHKVSFKHFSRESFQHFSRFSFGHAGNCDVLSHDTEGAVNSNKTQYFKILRLGAAYVN